MRTNKNPLRLTLETAAIGVSLFAMLAAVSPVTASAAEVELGNERLTALPMVYSHSKIVRERTPGKESVKFSAMDAEIDEQAVVVFEVRSVQKGKKVTRWRCVAERNVRECFDKPVRVKYLAADTRVVMDVRVQAAAAVPPALAAR